MHALLFLACSLTGTLSRLPAEPVVIPDLSSPRELVDEVRGFLQAARSSLQRWDRVPEQLKQQLGQAVYFTGVKDGVFAAALVMLASYLLFHRPATPGRAHLVALAVLLPFCLSMAADSSDAPKPDRPPFLAQASIGGNVAPDGVEIHCDLPGELHRSNTTSRGQGCCVWTSIHHAAVWQNVGAYQEAARWIQSHGIPGGAYPGAVERWLPRMARERGGVEVPKFLNYQGNDLKLLKLACQGGRMPAVTYSFSPTGRYGGARIAHMVSLLHADDRWFAILDNNYPGGKRIEWLSPEEFKRTFTGLGGWAVILLNPPPPPPPWN